VRHEAIFPSSYLSYDDYAVFTLFVTKDVRSATTSATVQSLGYGGGNMSAALDRIDELLKSGNTNVALAVMNLVTASLNSGSDVWAQFDCLPPLSCASRPCDFDLTSRARETGRRDGWPVGNTVTSYF
jgi:hypothetical protein